MRALLAGLVLLAPLVAQAADDGTVTTSLSPDRRIAVSYKTVAANDISLVVMARDAVSPVKQVLIQSGNRTLATCNARLCEAVWKRSNMPSSINDLMVTVTNTAGQKFGMPTRVPRPSAQPQLTDLGKGYYLQVLWSCDFDGECGTLCDTDGANCRLDTGFLDNRGYGKAEDGTSTLPEGVKPYDLIVYPTRVACEDRGKVIIAPEANQVGENGLRPIKQVVCLPLP